MDDWVPDAPAGPSGDDALAELARRYFTAYSPATAADFATWSGLAGRRAVELIRDELTPVDIDGAPGFRLGEVEPQRGVRLLPAFDNYLVGYRDRRATSRRSGSRTSIRAAGSSRRRPRRAGGRHVVDRAVRRAPAGWTSAVRAVVGPVRDAVAPRPTTSAASSTAP